MELQVISTDGQAAESQMTVADAAFAQEFNEALVHQIVVAYMAAGRAGTKAQKTRSEVNGGGAKPWRQKGTGRARAGTIRSPLWRGGGVTFAAAPRDHSQKVNKKMYRAAMRSIFSELLRQERLLVVNDLTLEQPKTKAMLAWLSKIGVADNALLIVDDMKPDVYLAARNLPKVDVCDPVGVDPVRLIGFEKIVVTKSALERIGEWLA